MPSFWAASLVIGMLVLFSGPILYYIFYIDGAGPKNQSIEEPEPRLMGDDEIKRIEAELDVTLPKDYINAVSKFRTKNVDSTALIDHADGVIEATLLYRNGFEGLPCWPSNYIYIGDEADACPYALNIESGQVFRLDKGNVRNEALKVFSSTNAFVAYLNE